MTWWREPWRRTLVLLCLSQVVSGVGFSVFYPFLPVYIRHLGSTTGISLEFWSGVVFGGQALVMALVAPLWGSLADRYGRKPMLERALYGGAAVILLMGFARSAEDLALLRALQGAITGTIAAANALAAATAPREKVGSAMSALMVGQWAGAAVGPLVGGVVADALGFRAVFELTAALLLAAGVIVTLTVREQFARPERGAARPGVVADWRRILGTRSVAAAYVVRFADWMGPTMLLPIMPLFIATLDVGEGQLNTVTGLVVAVSSAAGTLAAVAAGPLGDRAGHRRVLIVATLLTGLLAFPHALVTSAWQLLALQALQGATAGAMGPALSALLARYTRPEDAGAVFGLDGSVTAAARAVAPLLAAGAVLELGQRGVFIVIGVVLLGAAATALLGVPERLPEREAPRPEAA